MSFISFNLHIGNRKNVLMKHLKKISLLFLLILSGLWLGAQSKEPMATFRQHEMQNLQETISGTYAGRGDENIDAKFYHISIEVAIDSAYISGNVICKLTPVVENLDEFRLDLDRSLTVDSISAPCDTFYQDGDEIVIHLESSFNPGDLISIQLFYKGIPVLAGGYKGLRYEKHDGNQPVIATLSTPFLAHYWYPCKDGSQDKADSVYVNIIHENRIVNGLPLIAVSNGVLEEVELVGTKRISKWRHRYPIVAYYVMLAISNYQLIEDLYTNDNGDSIPLDYYVFAEDFVSQEEGVAEIPEAIDFFNSIYGLYPFADEKYGMTQLGFYSAIENQTNTIINTMQPSWFLISVHELSHMWFADMITCETWNHAWLNEGFATYSEALWTEHTSGSDAYHSYLNSLQYFDGGTLYLESPLDTFQVFTAIIYDKGAWALHMLRGVVGDSLFFESIENYATSRDFMYQNATTEQLREVFETTCEMDLNFYFDQWIYDTYYPIYHYNFTQIDNRLYVALYQAQEEIHGRRPVFEMPVPLKISFEDSSDTTITVWNNLQLQEFEFEIKKTVGFVSVDPDQWILRQEFYKPELPVGISENKIVNKAVVFPNPFTELVNIQIIDKSLLPATIKLFDISGRELISFPVTVKNQQLNLSTLKNGLYFYRFFDVSNKPVLNGKLIKN